MYTILFYIITKALIPLFTHYIDDYVIIKYIIDIFAIYNCNFKSTHPHKKQWFLVIQHINKGALQKTNKTYT